MAFEDWTIYHVLRQGDGAWRVSIDGVDSATAYASRDHCIAAARLLARLHHLRTQSPTEVWAPNFANIHERIVTYMTPNDLDELIRKSCSQLFATERMG